jgi:hypothetical protein
MLLVLAGSWVRLAGASVVGVWLSRFSSVSFLGFWLRNIENKKLGNEIKKEPQLLDFIRRISIMARP